MVLNVQRNRPPIDSEALKKFQNGAYSAPEAEAQTTPDNQEPVVAPAAAIAAPVNTIDKAVPRHKPFLLRMSEEEFDELNFVYKNTNVKSRQELVQNILLPELRRLSTKIRQAQAGDPGLASDTP